ncbi:MAG TPA: glutathione S-transferase family protein [Gaiellaceae bacterium]|jgi:glutathione S-transferase|nr:glutathione S-transferase family protein [Gaiellaceae bacterium]
MSLKLNMLPPSVNNMSVRVFVRAAGLPFEEENVWGKTQEKEYLSKIPSGLTPSVESEELPKGGLWESCAVMMYLADREGLSDLYPTDLARRAMVNSANFYTMSMLYPLVARATYPRLSFAGYPGEVATSEASDDDKEAARKAAEAELPRLLEVYRQFFLEDGGFIGGGEGPSIADIRLVCTLEFLAVTDTELPSWTKDYMERVESALGDAYSEPAGDVRGYVAQVTGETVATG